VVTVFALGNQFETEWRGVSSLVERLDAGDWIPVAELLGPSRDGLAARRLVTFLAGVGAVEVAEP
jgi:hypothetical protein